MKDVISRLVLISFEHDKKIQKDTNKQLQEEEKNRIKDVLFIQIQLNMHGRC